MRGAVVTFLGLVAAAWAVDHAAMTRHHDPVSGRPSQADVPPPQCSPPATAPSANQPVTDGTADQVISSRRLISFWLIGASSPHAEDRRIGQGIKRRGWEGFVSEEILPQIAWGVRRFQIHNPFGHDEAERMRLDQYLLAQNAGLVWAVDHFVEAWRPLTTGLYGPDIEVICYLGSPVAQEPFTTLYQSGRIDEWQRLFHASIQPAIEADMSLAFDSATDFDADHPFAQALNELEAAGRSVYLEGLPSRNAPHLWSRNFIIMERYLERMPQLGWVADRDQLTGEIIWLVDRRPPQFTDEDAGWQVRHYAQIMAQGYTVSARMGPLIEQGVAVTQLVTAAQYAADASRALEGGVGGER